MKQFLLRDERDERYGRERHREREDKEDRYRDDRYARDDRGRDEKQVWTVEFSVILYESLFFHLLPCIGWKQQETCFLL